MRITLEKSDLVRLLGKALNYELNEEDVEVQPEPFEVHVRNIRLNELAASSPPAPAPKAEAAVVSATGYPPDRPLASLDELMNQNNEMLRENLAPGETYDPPDPDEENYLG